MTLTTYADAIDNILDYYGSDPSAESQRYARRAVQTAYREMGAAKRWTYFMARGRIVLSAQYLTGTIAYTAATKTMTLTGGVWPAWAAFGTVRIGSVQYDVALRLSDTQITLSELGLPPGDIAALTSYNLYRDTYPMPMDFVASGQVIIKGFAMGLGYQHPDTWNSVQRLALGPATPRLYTYTSDPNYFGAMAIRFWPAPDAVYELDLIYQRQPRIISVLDYHTGSASTSAASTTVAGSGTQWTSAMVGSVIRFSEDSQNLPTGPGGLSPALLERVVSSVTTPTSLELDAVPGNTLNGVFYRISDPVDIESGAMLTFFMRECEKQARLVRRMKAMDEENAAYLAARTLAFEGDSRSFDARTAGISNVYRPRLRDFPRGPDQS